MTAETAETELVRVALVGLPVPLAARAQEHFDELSREFFLMTSSGAQHHRVPVRLLELVEQLTSQYGGFTSEQSAALDRAIRDGVPTLDLEYRVPAAAAAGTAQLAELLDEVDDYCRAGEHLLTLETPPECVEYRRWYLGQFVDQIAGRPPVPWDQWRARA